MIDIVTVVFQEELEVIQLQAHSIEKFCQLLDIKNIFVMVNDSIELVDQIDCNWWGALADRVKIIPRQQFAVEYTEIGWLDQQLLKILGSSLSDNNWSMILDAKTILVKPWTKELIFDSQGKLTTGLHPIQPVFAQSGIMVSELFGINLEYVAGPAGVPFIFNNQWIRDMIKEIENRTEQNFAQWFLNAGKITEFILYTGYVQWLHNGLDHCYSQVADTYQVCNICHSETSNYNLKIKDLTSGNNHSVSIHRNCWKTLTTEQKYMYIDFLIKQGFSKAEILCKH